MANHKKFVTVSEYIQSLASDIQEKIQELRRIILEEIADGEEVISYNLPAVAMKGKCVVYYSAWKDHLSVYPFTKEMEKWLEAKDFVMSGKGTIQFPYDKDLPKDLIRKIVKYHLDKLI